MLQDSADTGDYGLAQDGLTQALPEEFPCVIVSRCFEDTTLSPGDGGDNMKIEVASHCF